MEIPNLTVLHPVAPNSTPDQAEIDALSRPHHDIHPDDAPDPLVRRMIAASVVLILAALGVGFLAGGL